MATECLPMAIECPADCHYTTTERDTHAHTHIVSIVVATRARDRVRAGSVCTGTSALCWHYCSFEITFPTAATSITHRHSLVPHRWWCRLCRELSLRRTALWSCAYVCRQYIARTKGLRAKMHNSRPRRHVCCVFDNRYHERKCTPFAYSDSCDRQHRAHQVAVLSFPPRRLDLFATHSHLVAVDGTNYSD